MIELLRRVALGAGLFAAALVVAPLVAAAGNALDGASVSPGSGTTATDFRFSVHYSSRQGHAPSKVTASAGAKTVTLSLVSGTAGDGIYRGSARLPVGSWKVVFSATVSQGKSPTLAGPTVNVTAAPVATPKPVSKPPPVVAPAPVVPQPPPPVPPAAVIIAPAPPASAAPAPAAPVASPKAKVSAAPVARKASPAAHSAAPSSNAVPAPTKDQQQQLSNLMLGGVGVIGLIAAFWFLLAGRRGSEPVEEAVPEVAVHRPPEKPAAPDPWDAAQRLDDEPIGTVDYLPLGNGEAIGTPPPAEPRRRGTNPHAARIQAARGSREAYDR
jgi:hypothetical protein